MDWPSKLGAEVILKFSSDKKQHQDGRSRSIVGFMLSGSPVVFGASSFEFLSSPFSSPPPRCTGHLLPGKKATTELDG